MLSSPPMTTNILLGILIALAGIITWKLFRVPATKTSDEDTVPKSQFEDLEKELAEVQSTKDKLEGSGKQLYAQHEKLQASYNSLSQERDDLKQDVANYRADEEQRQQKHEDLIREQAETRKALEDERIRIRREDEERQAQILEERDRLWKEHEETVISEMTRLCQSGELQFQYFDNENLPSGFDSSLEPDFMIEFLNQYVIFDAKLGKSRNNFKNYIAANTKKYAEKYKKYPEIYPVVFNIVPTDCLSLLNKYVYTEGNFTFYIISMEAVVPVLSCFKRMAQYETLEQIDPQDRANIIRYMAKLEHHLNQRNSMDVALARMGSAALGDARSIDSSIAQEVVQEQEKMRVSPPTIKTVEKLMKPEAREQAIEELIQPTAAIDVS